MKVLDPGHRYELEHLDGKKSSTLSFVKREGEKYPGNVGHHEGTNMQEVIRALIDRIKYVNKQIPDESNLVVLDSLRTCIRQLESRAAKRHNRVDPWLYADSLQPEIATVCCVCGHVGCNTANHCELLQLGEAN